jgi:AAA domain
VPTPKTKKLLTSYLRRLTNLSGNNRSIFLPRLSSEQFIDLHDLSFLNGKNSFSIIQQLIEGKAHAIAAELDSRMAANNEISQRLKKINRLDRFIYEERGTKDLHVGWPFVHGQFMDGTLVRCPLIYFPVVTVLEKGNWVLQPRANAEISFNKSFLLAYSFYNQTQPANEALEEDFEDADRDSAVFRTYIYQALQRNNLEIHFNPDNYRDELTSFKTFKKEQFEKATETGRLKLFPEAVLGVFPQAGSSLVPDYLQLLEQEAMVDLEDFFAQRTSKERNTDTHFLNEIKEEKVYTVFPMDAWQENALKGVKLGHSLVVQGPPGTGKSQLISNLISDMIANKKRVLLVCQKRVALDVVYQRLREKRLDDFIGLVHDFKEDRKELYHKLARQIDRVGEYRQKNNSLDSIQLERKFYDISRKIDQVVYELERFKEYLFDESDCGISVKQLYLLSSPTVAAIELKQELSFFKWDQAKAFKSRMKAFVRLANRFSLPDYPWKNRKSFSTFSLGDLTMIKETLKEIRPWFVALNKEIAQVTNSPLDWEQCEIYEANCEAASELIQLIQTDEVFANFQKMVHESEEETSSLWLANMEKMIVECFSESGPELTVASPHLGQFQLALYRSMKVRRSLVGLIRWELFSTDKFLIKRTLVANGLKNTKNGLYELEEKLDRRLNLEHNLSKLKIVTWMPTSPAFASAEQVKLWFEQIQKAVKVKTLLASFRGLKTMLDPVHHTKGAFIENLQQLFSILSRFPAQQQKWSAWLVPSQIREVAEDEQKSNALEKIIHADFDALCEFDRLQEALEPHERSTLNKLTEHVGSYDEKTFEKTFINSIGLAWIDHIEQKHPELRIVSTGKMEILEEELDELIAEKESISSEILLMRAREGVVDDLEFNRLNNQVTYRDLQHQLTKRKKIWPIRKVVAEFEEDLFHLMPCWMASPESVSSIFPMKEIFDLVIFDEASQCFAERGIPALYRGKQAVIAGDPQQLQPSDLYTARWEEETDDPDSEITSLLELGNRHLLQVILQGHYRSQSPELIHFSNKYFYQNKLHLLPDCHRVNSSVPAIEFIKVQGRWIDNCNLVEAQQVVELILENTSLHPGKEIGVITFNAPQQSLILDLLDLVEKEKSWTRPPTLFVKNIENVQGDEKDMIIFSVGYAPDEKGKLTVQFGSLNLAGGENRLNVAITRAREKIILVSSVEPEDLKVADTKNDGPRLLQAYLKYAREISTQQIPEEKAEPAPHKADWYLKSQIRDGLQKNYRAEEKFPFADFALKREGKYHGLLLTDDDIYYENLSCKSAHGLLPKLFQEKNWKQKMIYSRNWWMDKEKFWNEIGKFCL